MAVHQPLGEAGGAARLEQDQELVAGDRPLEGRRGLVTFVEQPAVGGHLTAPFAEAGDHADARHPPGGVACRLEMGVAGEQRSGLAVGEDAGDLLRDQAAVDRHRHQPHAGEGEKRL